jgi:hypothetical protein
VAGDGSQVAFGSGDRPQPAHAEVVQELRA